VCSAGSVMQTDRGREILKERFSVGFDQRREELLGLAVKKTTLTLIRRRGANEDVERTTQKMLICTEVSQKRRKRIMHQPTDSCICPQLENILETNSSHDLTFFLKTYSPIPHTRLRVPQDNLGTDLSIG
jgi:hypothetical protein